MAELLVREFTQQEWAEVVGGCDALSLLQTWEYGEAKAQTTPWRVVRAMFTDGGRSIGAVQALVRTVPWVRGGLVWVNRGPLWLQAGTASDDAVVALRELRRFWVERQGMYIRIAPPVGEEDATVKALGDAGFQFDGRAPRWASARVALAQPLQALRAGLHQKWRNGLNKAERMGVTVRGGVDPGLLEEFLREYRHLLSQRRFEASVTPALLARLRALAPDDRKPYVLVASYEGRPAGGVLIARYGETGEYLAGVTTAAGRAVSAGQLLLWQAMSAMKDLGTRWFDLGGMDPERTPPGIYHFKEGLGGTPYRLLGEFEALDGRWPSRLVRWRVTRARVSAGA